MTPKQALELRKRLDLRRATQRRTSYVDVPRSFEAFCRWLGVTLTPGQAELARVAFDHAQPVDRELAARLFGPIGGVPVGARRVVAAVCGARGGKSYVLVALRLVWGMLVRDLSGLAPGQRAVALIIAPNDKLRSEVMNYAVGAVRSRTELAAMLTGEPTADRFEIRRQDGALVAFETGVATRGGYGARGRWLTDFALDESAFFRDASYKVNDEEIFRAGAARVLPGGQTIVASTPWAEAGLLYQLWRDNWGRPSTAIVAHAPTLLLHDSPATRGAVESETARDPENARREFEARFMASGTSVFFESAAIDAATTDEPFVAQPGDVIAAGGDFGFRSDSSALILVALRHGTLHVFDGLELRPEEGRPLRPGDTVAAFARLITGRCSHLMADQHYRESIAEHLDAHGLAYAAAPAQPADSYVRARMLLRQGAVVLHPTPFRERMVQQMREVQGRPTSGGAMSIQHPRWARGGHGDLVAALVLALWQVSGDQVQAPPPQMGTKEHEQMLVDRRHAAWEAERSRPAWARGSDRAVWAARQGRLR